MTEWEKVKKVLNNWVGYTEKNSSANIQYKTKSPGNSNYTIFGAMLRFLFPEMGDTFEIDYAWCLQEQIAADVIALGLERAQEVLPALTAYTPSMAEAFKKKGWWGTEPKEGAYILEIQRAPEDAMLYLTYEGRAIWNLSYSPYVFDLTKGMTEGYGLKLYANPAPQITTGIENDEVLNGENGVRKVIIDNTMYIITQDGAMYDVTGKSVK